MAWRSPNTCAKRRSNSAANRPVVSQKSSDGVDQRLAARRRRTPGRTTGTGVSPGTNARSRRPPRGSRATRSAICRRSSPARPASWSGTEELPIPGDRPVQALLQREGGASSPAARAPSPARSDWCGISCLASLRTIGSSGLAIAARIWRVRSSTVIRRSSEKLNASPPSAGSAGQPLGQQQVGGGAVLDVEVVADERAVGADDRPLAAQHASGWCRGRGGSS